MHFIFDMDGTLLDSAATAGKPVIDALREVKGIEVPHEEVLMHLDGFDYKWFIEPYGLTPEEAADVDRIMRENWWKNKTSHHEPPLFPGTTDLLRTLQESGAELHACSARDVANIDEQMARLGIRQYFGHLMGRTDENRAGVKEKSDVLKYFIPELHLDLDDCVMIGDMPGDIRAGKDAGIKTIGVTYGYAPRWYLAQWEPDLLADTMEELKELLLNMQNQEK